MTGHDRLAEMFPEFFGPQDKGLMELRKLQLLFKQYWAIGR